MATVYITLMHDKNNGTQLVYAGVSAKQAVNKAKYYANFYNAKRATWIE